MANGNTPNTHDGDQKERRTDGEKLPWEQGAIPHESSMLLKIVVRTVIGKIRKDRGS